MKLQFRILALAAAGMLLTNSISQHFSVHLPQIPDYPNLSDFADQIRKAEEPAAPFCSLRYSENDQQLYRDGHAVGQKYAGCCVQNNSLMISTDDENDLTLQQASEQIGCEISETDGEMTVQLPFQTARLIVKSMQQPELYGGTLIASGYRDLYVIQYDSQQEAYQAYQAYQDDPDICFTDCDRILSAAEFTNYLATSPSEICGTAEIGTDEYCEWLKNEKTELPEIRVAVVDSGIYAEHSWLTGRVLPEGANFCSGISMDASDDNGHGTHVAGIIAAGTPENVRLMPVKVLNDSGYGSLLTIYCGLMYALEQNADVINLSLGGYGESPLLDDAVAAIAEADIPLCVAAGNEKTHVRYIHPAYSDQVITVSAVNQKHKLADFSNYGNTVDFAAPGVDITSASITSPSAVKSENGTSMAAPFVTAAIADLLSYDPEMTNQQVYDNLRSNATDLGTKGFDEQYGWGEISLRDFYFTNTFCRPPVITPNGGRFRSALSVALLPDADAEEETEIYYTTDGSEPNPETGIRYTGDAINLEQSARIKAISVYKNGQSKTVTADYCFNREDVPEPYEIKNGVLTAYRGIMDAPDLTGFEGDLTEIGEGAFSNLLNLESVQLPDSVTAIGANAFSGCSNLTEITGKNVSAVGQGAFSGCSSLIKADFLPLEKLCESAFRNCRKLRSLINGISDTITIIPPNAFRDCAALTEISAPSVTEIGSYAFEGCKKIQFREQDIWDQIESVGAHAFEHSGLSGTVNLSALRTLSAYAFANSSISEVILPDSITHLPEGVFRDTENLGRITAHGVASLDAYALQQTVPRSVIMDMDFGQITSIGCSAFDGIRFTEPAVFSGLRTVETGALNGIQGPGFYFPDVQTLESNAISQAENAVLYFENLVTVRKDAVKQIHALVVGEKLITLEPSSVSADFIAGPAGSIAEQYAGQSHINFKSTPSLLTNQLNSTVNTDEFVQLQALPLGFDDLRVVWQDEAGGILKDDQSGVYTEISDTVGDYTCTAELFQGDTKIDSVRFQVHVRNQSKTRTTELKLDTLQIIDVNRDLAEEIVQPTVNNAYHYNYRYHAEKDDVCRLFLSGINNTVAISDSEGNPVSIQWESTYEENDKIAMFVCKKSCSYLIDVTIMYYPLQNTASFCAMRLSTRDDNDLKLLSDNNIILNAGEYSEYIWQGGPAMPDEILLQEMNEGIPADLSENDDYIVYCTNNTAVGLATCWLIGIGNYCGSQSFTFQIVGQLEDGKTLETPAHGYNMVFDFIPEQTGNYVIYPDYSAKWVEKQKALNYFESYQWSYIANVFVSERNIEPVDPLSSQHEENYTFTELFTFPLKKGVQYRIVVYVNGENQTLPHISICPKRGVRLIQDYNFSFDDDSHNYDYNDYENGPKPIQMTSDEYTGQISCDHELADGENYKVTYIANDRAGEMGVIITGNGNLSGTTYIHCPLIGVLNESHSANAYTPYDDSTVTYQFTPITSGTYTFYTDYPEELLKQMKQTGCFNPDTLSPAAQTKMTLMDGNKTFLQFNTRSGPARFSAIEYELQAGETYFIQLEGTPDTEFDLHVKKDCHTFAEAEIDYPDTISDDTLSSNPVTVTLHNTPLTEGTDYTVTLLESEEEGQYMYMVNGIGDYCGTQYCPLTVTSADQLKLEFGVPFTQMQTSASYSLTLTDNAVVRLRPADASKKPFDAELRSITDTDAIWHFDADLQNLTLPAGSYTMTLEQEFGMERSYLLEILDTLYPLSECTVEVQNAVETGQAVQPEFTISYRNERTEEISVLKEGVDYQIADSMDWTAPGQYNIRLTGIGNFYGEKMTSFCVLPSDPESLPLLTDGKYTADISEPGKTLFYRWNPKQHSCMTSDSIRNRRFCFYTGAKMAAEYNGSGYQSFIPEINANASCIVAVSFCSASETGSFGFEVKSDFSELNLCKTEMEDAVLLSTDDTVPEYKLMDGQYVLKEGIDYKVFSIGGTTHFGMAEIVLHGIGRYIGEYKLNYFIYPEDISSIPEDDLIIEKEITLKEKSTYQFPLPGNAAVFTFTAPQDGTYYLVNKPETLNTVSMFVYLPDGKLNRIRSTGIELSADDSIRILLIRNWLSAVPAVNGQISVVSSAPSYIWTDESSGITYFVQGDSATITDIETSAVGLTLPDEITDPDTGEVKVISDIHADVLRDFADRITFYLTPGGYAEQNLASKEGFCYAYAFPESAERGDVTGTGGVDQNDVLTLFRILSEGEGMILSDKTAEAADCNGDGILDLQDIQAIREMLQSKV